MLLARLGVALVFERAKRRDQFRPRLARLDDGVDIAALGSHVGICESLPELRDFFLP